MRCATFIEGLDSWLVGELMEVDALEFSEHARGCAPCGRAVQVRGGERAALAALASGATCSAELLSRLGGCLDREDDARTRSARAGHHRVAALAAVVVVGLAGAGVLGGMRVWAVAQSEPAGDAASAMAASVHEPFIEEVVRWHRRVIPIEVTGPDMDVVGAWFEGKVDFPVAPPNFRRGAHLLGGRLGHVEDADAAMLVYEAEGSKLSVMLFDASARPLPPQLATRLGAAPAFVGHASGYSVAVRLHNDVAYVFTSELSGERLQALIASSLAP